MQGVSRIGVLALTVLALCACSSKQGGEAGPGVLAEAPEGTVVAVVNGETLTEPLLVAYARQRGLDLADAAQRKQALDALVDTILLAQDAVQGGLDEGAEIRTEVTLSRAALLANYRMKDHRDHLEVSERQIMELYLREKERAGDTEWRFEHMLFADEATAKAWLDRAVLPAADFTALMGEAQAAGARQSKALGWSNASQLPPELVTALRQLEDGSIAPVVIRSEYGFHVLRRVEARPFTPPPMEQVREGATRQIIESASREFLDGLRKRASIVTAAQQPAG